MRLRADLLFPNSFIHGVCSVLSFYAAFAFQNCSYGVQELKGKHALRKIEIIYVWQFVSSVAQKRNFVDVIDWSVKKIYLESVAPVRYFIYKLKVRYSS